ncbi:VWA domain-containing protein [Microbacterium sp. QXD-8]|uniref:VWA domain-containing protein n=1 Tax=Microbacterium psychrotolerans TaxID=3068321 RepID=A0ABU0Z301_9MICO|nr:VWA domain-containing protein [Microbacterium sp. QXD-8]MDQ7878373.1 VWA domain-containing protein [Microbacterium sp. QXD-8]
MNNDASSRREVRQHARNRRRTRRSAAAVAATVLSAGLVLGGLAPALAVPSAAPATSVDTAVQAITPLAAPSIPSTGAAVTVNLRTLRAASSGQTTTSATAGITLELRNEVTVDSGATYGSTVVATCTTDADGDCSFVLTNVPTSNGSRYWVVPTATTGPDAFLSQYLVTGDNTDSAGDNDRFATTPYAFRTPAITRSQTPYQVPTSGTGNMPGSSRVGNPGVPLSRTVSTSNRWNHYGTEMVATIDNPRFAPTCTPGLKVALIVDTSTSMTYNGNEGLNGARTASRAFATAFANKGVSLGIYQFGNDAATVMTPTVVTSANLSSVTSKINGISVSGTQYTNWDRGIEQVAGADYDIAVMLTDGNPTRYRSNSGNGSWTDLRGIEEAILSANLVKAQGTQMITFGVGDYLNPNTPYNLASVTGPVQWTANGGIPIGQADFAIPTSWDVVATQLGNLASSLTCEATVQVRKQERAGNGALTDAAGWTFTPTKTGAGTMTPAGAQTTATGGSLPQPWRIAFTAANQTANVSITETAKPGWSVESVTCLKNGAPLSGIPSAATFSLTGLVVGDAVVCTVVNGQAATVQANKTWVVKDSAGTTVGTYHQRGNAGDAAVPAGLAATPGLGATPSAKWGTVYSAFSIGQQLALRETSTIDAQLLPGCVLTSQQLTAGNGLSTGLPFDLTKGDYIATLVGGANVFEFTNTVTCTQTLELVKVVAAPGTEKTSAWTLEAKAPSGALTGPKGTYSASTPVTASVSPAAAYTLSESGGPDTYVPASAGWQCVLTGTTTAVGVSNAKVTVPLGQKVTCTITNTTATLTLLKKTADGSGLAPADFTLTGTPASGFTLAVLQTPGATAANAGNSFEVRPAHTYTLAETDDSGTIAYRNLGLQKLKPGTDPALDANWENVASAEVQVAAGEQAIYRFVNDKVPAVVLPLTGGTASDAFLLLGGAIVSAVVAVAAWRAARRMKRGTA